MRLLPLALKFGLFACILALGCGPAPTYNWKGESVVGYKLGTGDVVKVTVWKHEEVSIPNVAVRPDGAITMPLAGDVPAKGRTAQEVGKEITERLKQFYQDQAPVTVQVLEIKSYRVYAVGEVNHPGEFVPTGEVSTLQLLALSGGFTRFADPNRIVIIRRDAKGERRIPIDYSAIVERGELDQNLTLQSGDTVVVP